MSDSFVPNAPMQLDMAPEPKDSYTVKRGPVAGLRIKVKAIQPLLLNKVLRSVRLPKRPTYETQTVTGSVQVHPMDEESAAETPNGKAIWAYYQEQLEEAQSEQNDRMTNAIFAMGCEFEYPASSEGWEAEHELLGIEVPKEKRLKKAHFLATSLEADEISEITTLIMQNSGVSEEAVQEAEDSFRSAVHGGSGQAGNVVEHVRDQRQNPQEQMAVQRSL